MISQIYNCFNFSESVDAALHV